MRKEYLIRVISRNSDRYGDKLIDFMQTFGLSCLADATPEQLTEYIARNNLKSEMEATA